MFGIGGSEIIVILIVALLFLGPDKLPDAAKQISKGIRDIKKQSRMLQTQIENDETIGGAIRDLKSALRGEEPVHRPPVRKEPPKVIDAAEATAAAATAVEGANAAPALTPSELAIAASVTPDPAPEAVAAAEAKPAVPTVTLPPMAGEPDPDVPAGDADHDELGHLIKPAPGTVAKTNG